MRRMFCCQSHCRLSEAGGHSGRQVEMSRLVRSLGSIDTHNWSLSQKTHSQLCRQSLSKHFVEVPLKMALFRQSFPTKDADKDSATSPLGQALIRSTCPSSMPALKRAEARAPSLTATVFGIC
jgi:hypothetical protein